MDLDLYIECSYHSGFKGRKEITTSMMLLAPGSRKTHLITVFLNYRVEHFLHRSFESSWGSNLPPIDG